MVSREISVVTFLITIYTMVPYCICSSKVGGLGNVGCTSDGECAANAYCTDRYCMCKNDFVQDSSTSTCLPRLRHINDSCVIDVQCAAEFGIHSYCNKYVGQCRCMDNAHFEDGICYESVRLGGRCKVSDNCVSKSGVATYCAQSVCICAANYHASADGTDCIKNIALGQNCKKDEDCVADFSYCNGICLCQSSHVKSSDGQNCLLAAKSLRGQCVEHSQCSKFLSNTYCDLQDRICKCEPFTHELDQTCWKSVRLGEECSNPNQCITPSHNRSEVTCNKGVCGCAPGFSRDGSGCVKVKDVVASSTASSYSLLVILLPLLLNFHVIE